MTDALRLPPTSRIYNLFVLGPAGLGNAAWCGRYWRLHAAGRPTPADWSDMTRLHEPAAEAMHVVPDLPSMEALVSRQAGEVIRLARQRASVALLPASSLSDGDEQVRLLLEESTCPLVLVL